MQAYGAYNFTPRNKVFAPLRSFLIHLLKNFPGMFIVRKLFFPHTRAFCIPSVPMWIQTHERGFQVKSLDSLFGCGCAVGTFFK